MQKSSNIGQKEPSHWPQANLINWWKVCWSFDVLWIPWLHLLMMKFWKKSHPPIGLRSHPLEWQNLPQRNAAITGPVGLMLEDHSQQPMVRDSQKPQPLPRWHVNKPLQLGRLSHNRKVPEVNGQHSHQGLWRSLNPCMGITHWG